MGSLIPRYQIHVPCLLCFLLSFAFVSERASGREWVDNTGRHRVEADFVQVVNAKVHLRKPNGKVIAVPLNRLSEEDLQLVENLIIKSAQTRIVPKQQTAPAPEKTEPTIALIQEKEPNETPSALASVLKRQGLTPDHTIRSIMRGLAAHQPEVLWDALPKSYQADIIALLPAYARQIDPELWQAAVPVLRKSIVVVHKQRGFLSEHPVVKLTFADLTTESERAQSEEAATADTNEESWDALVSALVILAKSDLADRDRLLALSPGEFLSTTGAEVMHELSVASEHARQDDFNHMLELLSQMEVSVVSTEGETAIIRLESAGQAEENQMVRVEGKWIPADLALAWPIAIEQGRAGVAWLESAMQSEQRQVWLSTLQAAEAGLDQLLAAETQQEFNERLASLLSLLPQTLPTAEAPSSLSLNETMHSSLVPHPAVVGIRNQR